MKQKFHKGAGKLSYLRIALTKRRKLGFEIVTKSGQVYSVTRFVNKKQQEIMKSQGKQALLYSLMTGIDRISSMKGSIHYTILATPRVVRDSSTGSSSLCQVLVTER